MNSTTSATDDAGKIWLGPELSDLEAKVRQWKSLAHYFMQRLTDNAQATIFTDFASGRRWTGAEFQDKVLAVACALVDEHHFRPGTMVCLSYDNTDYLIILSVAVLVAGGSLASCYHKEPYAELLYLAKKVEPGFLFCHAKNLVWTRQLERDLSYPVTGIAMDGTDLDDQYSFCHMFNYDYKTRSQAYSNKLLPVACRVDLEHQIALVTMSSGTTGKPKAVAQSHYNCLADLLGTGIRATRAITQFNIACSVSLDYVSGRLIIFGAISRGYNAIILSHFEPVSYLQALEQYKCMIIYLGAASFYNLITHPDIDKYDLSELRSIFPMGAKISYQRELANFLAKRPNIMQVRQGYGASEFGGAAIKSMIPEEYLSDPNNCGHLFPGFKAKVLDPSGSGRLLGPNQEGLLHIKGPTVFPGYYDKDQARANSKLAGETMPNTDIDDQPEVSLFVWDSSVFDADRYYITGDLGYFNDQEELFIVGRQKELMSCRGARKVLPQEIEEVLERHPAVKKVCVLGMPNKREPTLQCPRAFVVPKKEYYSETYREQLELRPKLDVCNRELEEELEREVLVHAGQHTLLTGMSSEWRHTLTEDLMAFLNERVSVDKHLTGGLVLLDDIPTSRATGKIDKNYLRSLTFAQVEVFGDRSG